MALPEGFDAEVYSVVAQIPAGRVTTYGQIARLIGMPDHARRVGRAMASAWDMRGQRLPPDFPATGS